MRRAAAAPPRSRRRANDSVAPLASRRKARRRGGEEIAESQVKEEGGGEGKLEDEREEERRRATTGIDAVPTSPAVEASREVALSVGFWEEVAAASSSCCQQRFPSPLLLVVKSCHAPPPSAAAAAGGGKGGGRTAAGAANTAAGNPAASVAPPAAAATTTADPTAAAADTATKSRPTTAAVSAVKNGGQSSRIQQKAAAATAAAKHAATTAAEREDEPYAASAVVAPPGGLRRGVTQLVFATDGSRAADGAFYVGRVFLRREKLHDLLSCVIQLKNYTISSLQGRRCVLAAAVREFPKSCCGVASGVAATSAEKFVMHPGLLGCLAASPEEGMHQSSQSKKISAAASSPPAAASPPPAALSASAAIAAASLAAPVVASAAAAVAPATAAADAAPPAAAIAAVSGAAKTKTERRRQKLPVYDGRGSAPVIRQKGCVLVSIKDINAYTQNWLIRGRITDKGDIRYFANERGEGKLFSISILDHSETEIRATFFGSFVDTWHRRLRVGAVYEFSNGTVGLASRQFNTLPHQFEIKFGENADIQEAEEEEASSIPLQLLKPLQIAEILQKDAGSIVDVVGIVASFSDTHTVSSKHVLRQELRRKELTLLDKSNSVNVTLWENFAADFCEDEIIKIPLLAIKGARVSEYAGMTSLSSTPRARVYIGREVEAAEITGSRQLLEWWQQEGKRMHRAAGGTASVSGLTALSTVAAACRSVEARSLYFTCHVIIAAIERQSFLWLACPDCRRKVRRDFSRPPEKPSAAAAPSYYRCLRCSKTVDPSPQWALSLTLADPTGSLKSVAMDEHAQQLVEPLQVTAQSVQMLQAGGTDTFGRVLSDFFDLLLYRELMVRLCVKRSTFMGEDRVTCRVVGCSWVEKDFRSHMRTLLRDVEDYADRL